jgi:hypothetical protein
MPPFESDIMNEEEVPPIQDFNSLVRVVVGKKEVPFLIHVEVLQRESPYFVGAGKPEWMQKGEDGVGVIR